MIPGTAGFAGVFLEIMERGKKPPRMRRAPGAAYRSASDHVVRSRCINIERSVYQFLPYFFLGFFAVVFFAALALGAAFLATVFFAQAI